MSDHPPISPRFSSHVSGLPSESSQVLAVAGLVFALVSLLAVPCFFLIGAFFPPQGAGLRYLGLLVGIVSSLLGVILSALGLRAPSRRALAIVGLTLSIVVLVLLVLLMLYLIPVTGGSHH